MSRISEGAARFCANYPNVWHVIEVEGLSSARRNGLLPAATLRARAGAAPSSANRDDFERLTLANDLLAVLRFQQMQDEKLLPTLSGLYENQPGLWRAMIDRHVFFWATEERLGSFLGATQKQRARSAVHATAGPPKVLRFDTAR